MFAIEPGSAVARRTAAQLAERDASEDTAAVPVPAAATVKPASEPDSKFSAVIVVPGYGSAGGGIPALQACAPAVAGPGLSAGTPSTATTTAPARHSLNNRFIGRSSTIGIGPEPPALPSLRMCIRSLSAP